VTERYTAAAHDAHRLLVGRHREPLGVSGEAGEATDGPRRAAAGVTATNEYAYNLVGQLTQVTTDGTVSAAYSYDADGNRLTATTNTTSANATCDAQERLLTYELVCAMGMSSLPRDTLGEIRRGLRHVRQLHDAHSQQECHDTWMKELLTSPLSWAVRADRLRQIRAR
jgi:YD repeat-containing protein